MPREIVISEEQIRNLYEVQQLPLRVIANRLGRGQATVLRYMRIYGIKSRPQHQMSGRKLSEETKQKIRHSNTGRKVSAETRKKLSIAGRGKSKPVTAYYRRRRYVGGYIQIWAPDHPMSNQVGYIYEHRKLMSDNLKRLLLKTELVHHRNGVKDDNRIENLEIVTRKAHSNSHATRVECPYCQKGFTITAQLSSGRASI